MARQMLARDFAIYLADTSGGRVWLIDLDLMRGGQHDHIAGMPEVYGPMGASVCGAPDGQTFFTVEPRMATLGSAPPLDATYLDAHVVGDRRLWVTRFDKGRLRPGQAPRILEVDAYWRALRSHLDYAVIDAPATDRSKAGLKVAPFVDTNVIVTKNDVITTASFLTRDLARVDALCSTYFVMPSDRPAKARSQGSSPAEAAPIAAVAEMTRKTTPWRPDPMARAQFWLSVFVVLTFTQFWVMPITGPDGDVEASTLIRLLYFPAYFAVLGLLAIGWREALDMALRAPLLWAVMAVVFLSITWSIDPAVTMRRGVAVFLTTLAGLSLASRYEWPRLLEVMATAFAIVALTSFGLGLLLPSYGRMTELFPGAWRGAWFEKNGLGDNMSVACIAFCAAAILNRGRWWIWLGFAALAMALILLSRSKTSLVSLSLGFAALGFVGVVRRGAITAVVATFFTVTSLLMGSFALYFASDWAFKFINKDATLTGRTKLWAPILSQIQTRPWTGFGYAAVWSDKSIWGPLSWITKQAKFLAVLSHNS